MSRKPRTKGAPPSKLTGQLPVSAENSPWWDEVGSKLGTYGILVGSIYTVEELAQMIPCYPDGRRPRARTLVRRLASALELVQRGPNGSRGKGATYRILPERPSPSHDPNDEPVLVDEDWLNCAVEKMTRTKRLR